jgi:Tfp pilus assembly protein PilX
MGPVNAEALFMNPLNNSRGVSLIAATFIIVILAFMGVMFVSLIGTSSLTSVNDLQSGQALYLAEGGMEYIFQNRVFPNYSLTGTTTLGAGSFTVATPAELTAALTNVATTVTVNSTTGFPGAGRIVIDDEQINYTGTTATTFTGGTRAQGGTVAAPHALGNAVYPATTVTVNVLVGDTTINVGSTTGFLVPGVIRIDGEFIYCTNITATTFSGCARGYKSTPPAAHTAGVTRTVFQYVVTSTGTVGNAQRVVVANVSGSSSNAITYIGSASNPADGGNRGATPVAVTPPLAMLTGDLVVMIANSVTSGLTLAIFQAGGQTWTSETAVTTNGSLRLFWCRYNGTWTANPSVSFSTALNTTVVMHVFRPAIGTNTWALDVAQTTGIFAAPAVPRDVTITGITTVTNGALALFVWASQDNNSWALQTAGWANAGSFQYRNGASADSSQSAAYSIMATAGATGNVTNRQTATGGGGYDGGNTIKIAFRQISPKVVLDWREIYR